MADRTFDDISWRFVLTAVAIAGVAYLLRQLSQQWAEFLHVDTATGLWVLGCLVIWGLVQLAIYHLDVRARSWFTLALGSLPVCFLPAVNYWAMQQAPLPLIWTIDMERDVSSIWWATWYAKGAAIVLLGGVGYWVGRWWERQ